jgi:hypothetical protein
MWNKKKNKYGAHKVTVDGITFDSEREAHRWNRLKELEESGAIRDLNRQVKFVLIPAQREPETIGPRGAVKQGKIIEREVYYLADFVYIDNKTGEKVVEDAKGMRTKEYILKRKMMLYFHKIRIREV